MNRRDFLKGGAAVVGVALVPVSVVAAEKLLWFATPEIPMGEVCNGLVTLSVKDGVFVVDNDTAQRMIMSICYPYKDIQSFRALDVLPHTKQVIDIQTDGVVDVKQFYFVEMDGDKPAPVAEYRMLNNSYCSWKVRV